MYIYKGDPKFQDNLCNSLIINEMTVWKIVKIIHVINNIADPNVSDTSLSKTRMSATLRYQR